MVRLALPAFRRSRTPSRARRNAPAVSVSHAAGAAHRGAERIVLVLNGRWLLSADVLDGLRRAGAGLSAEGRALVVVCPDPRPRRLLLLTGFTRDFDLTTTLDAVVAA